MIFKTRQQRSFRKSTTMQACVLNSLRWKRILTPIPIATPVQALKTAAGADPQQKAEEAEENEVVRKACEVVRKNRSRGSLAAEKKLLLVLEPSGIRWTASAAEKALKSLWNDGPAALRLFNLLEKQRGFRHSAQAYDFMIDILGRMRDYRALWHLVARMAAPDGPNPNRKTFSIIIERYVAAGKHERALRVFTTDMQRFGCPPDLPAFNAFLDVLCKARKVRTAQRIFRQLQGRFSADSVTYNTLAYGWCLKKEPSMAQNVFRDMIRRGIQPTAVTYNTLLQGFFSCGLVKQAWAFFKEIKHRGFSPNVVTYTTIIYGLGMAGQIRKSRKVFETMLQNGCSPNAATYNALIQVLCRKQNVEEGFRVFSEMQSRPGLAPNLTTYNILVRGLCHSKQIDRALELVQEMEKNGCSPDARTFNIIIRYLCDFGEIERANTMLEDMVSGRCLPNLDTYNILLSALCGMAKPLYLVQAGKLLLQMVETGFFPRRLVYNRVIDGLFTTGNQSFARQILNLQSQNGRLPKEMRI